MSFAQSGPRFGKGLFTFGCALPVERCALLLITLFIKTNGIVLWQRQDIPEHH